MVHGPADENDSGKQRNHELRQEHSPGGFINDMSNGDDSGAIVSMGCQKNFRRHSCAPLRSKFVQKSLKRSLRVLHYPSSPEKGAEIEPFASAATLLIQRCVGGDQDGDLCTEKALPKIN